MAFILSSASHRFYTTTWDYNKDPELRYTASGIARTTFTLAVNRPIAQGEQQTDFIPVIVWRKAAENTAQYMKKGSLVAVEDRIEVRKFQDNDGTNRTYTAVVANRIQFLEPRRDNGNQSEFQEGTDSYDDPYDISDDDLPF